MVYNEELPAERTNRNYYLQLVSYLQGYKKALTDERVWTVVSGRLGKILKIVSIISLNNYLFVTYNLRFY